MFAGQNKHLGKKIQRVGSGTALHCTALHCTALHCTALRQVRGLVEHVGLYVGLAFYTLAGAKVGRLVKCSQTITSAADISDYRESGGTENASDIPSNSPPSPVPAQ
jgi:hypothetical protein